MEVRFIAQPEENAQLGAILADVLEDVRAIKAVIVVSAFASMTGVMRLKRPLFNLHAATAAVRVVVGVDLGGTSKEVLQELARWPFEVLIFKNKKRGVTFHPKIYLIEKSDHAEIFIGSNNLTDGGFFRNYEGAACVRYDLPADKEAYSRGASELAKFLAPKAPVAKRLDPAFLQKLLARDDIPSEAQARERTRKTKVGPRGPLHDDTFGFEATPGAKSLPVELQIAVIAANAQQMEELRKTKEARGSTATLGGKGLLLSVEPVAQLFPSAFYMELNATKGTRAAQGKKRNIPGEQRIPLEAVWSAKDFWGWPTSYERDENPGKGPKPATIDPNVDYEDRVYHNFYATWEISQVGDPSRHVASKQIRMYYYENSSDFRFYSSNIAKWGEPGDIVKIERVDNGMLDYRCQLAKKGTAEHAQWLAICQAGGNTARSCGFS